MPLDPAKLGTVYDALTEKIDGDRTKAYSDGAQVISNGIAEVIA